MVVVHIADPNLLSGPDPILDPDLIPFSYLVA